jgi:serine/threonine protein kinase
MKENASAMEGRRLDRYIVGERLGAGGFGTVYRARHTILGTDVALKVLSPQHAEAHEIVQRFLREAKAAAAIGHPHIIEIKDAGLSEDGLPFLAMELLVGEDLEHLLARGRLPPETAIEIAIQALQGLGAAHANGIVHRDMKPANLFVVRRPDGLPFVKVLDFGISKFDDPAERARLTGTGVTLGTPAYAAPEQITDTRNVDGRADLFAVAVIVFEAITGQLPYASDSFADIMSRVAGGTPARLDQVMPGASPALSGVLARAMSTRPEQRYGNADEMIRALASTRSTGHVMPVMPAAPSYPAPAYGATPPPSYTPAPGTFTGPIGGSSPYGPGSIPAPSMHAPIGPPAHVPPAPASKSGMGLWIGLGVLALFLPIACVGGGVVVWGLTAREEPPDPPVVVAPPHPVDPITKQGPRPDIAFPPQFPDISAPDQPTRNTEPPREPTLVPIPAGAPHCSIPIDVDVSCDREWDRHEVEPCASSAQRELFAIGSYGGVGGRVDLHVMRTAAPIVLALSAQERTTWEIHAAEGARIEHVILRGESEISGLDGVRVERGGYAPGSHTWEPWTDSLPPDWNGRAFSENAEARSRVPLRAFIGCYNPTRVVIGQRAP